MTSCSEFVFEPDLFNIRNGFQCKGQSFFGSDRVQRTEDQITREVRVVRQRAPLNGNIQTIRLKNWFIVVVFVQRYFVFYQLNKN